MVIHTQERTHPHLVDLGEQAGEVVDLMLAHGLALLGGGGGIVLECHLEGVVSVEEWDNLRKEGSDVSETKRREAQI